MTMSSQTINVTVPAGGVMSSD